MALLVFASMKDRETTRKVPDIRHIKAFVSPVPPGGTELVCIEDCRQCVLIDETNRPKEIEGLGARVDGYVLGADGEARRIDFGRFGDRKVCLRFHFYGNGSTSQMILKWKGKYYFIPAFFGAVKSFPDLREAVNHWREKNHMIQSPGDYY
jgi:hypothetical protein